MQPQLSHKNFRVREQVLLSIHRLADVYGEDIAAVSCLVEKIAPLLADPLGSVRQLAVQALARLYRVFGESMLVS